MRTRTRTRGRPGTAISVLRPRRAVAALVVLTLVSLLTTNLAVAGESGEHELHTFDETRLAAGPVTFRVPGTGIDFGDGITLGAAGEDVHVPVNAATDDTWYRLTLLIEKAAGSSLSYTEGTCPGDEVGVALEIFGTSSASTVEAVLEQQVTDAVTGATTWEQVASIGEYVNPHLGEKSRSPSGSACI